VRVSRRSVRSTLTAITFLRFAPKSPGTSGIQPTRRSAKEWSRPPPKDCLRINAPATRRTRWRLRRRVGRGAPASLCRRRRFFRAIVRDDASVSGKPYILWPRRDPEDKERFNGCLKRSEETTRREYCWCAYSLNGWLRLRPACLRFTVTSCATAGRSALLALLGIGVTYELKKRVLQGF
jgi:hypothetical protein